MVDFGAHEWFIILFGEGVMIGLVGGAGPGLVEV